MEKLTDTMTPSKPKFIYVIHSFGILHSIRVIVHTASVIFIINAAKEFRLVFLHSYGANMHYHLAVKLNIIFMRSFSSF